MAVRRAFARRSLISSGVIDVIDSVLHAARDDFA